MSGEPELSLDFYEYTPYINGALVTVNKEKVKDAKSFVLYYNKKEITEFEDSIFIPSDPHPELSKNYISYYSICAKFEKGLSNPVSLATKSAAYTIKDYDLDLTQKSETYDSITFEWNLNLHNNLKFHELENSELKCLLAESNAKIDKTKLLGEDIGNKQVVISKLEPAKTYSFYGHLIYSYTDLLGVRHDNVVTNLYSYFKCHTKALDKIENVSVTTKRTSAEFSFTELAGEQLHGITNPAYFVRITNKDNLEEKPFTESLSKDAATGKYSVKGLTADTNYQFELFAAQDKDFAEFADMAIVEAKTAEPLATLSAPKLTADESYDIDLKTSFTVEFEKHPYDTAEHPMEYQVEYYLFKTTSPKKVNAEYFDYPSSGKVIVNNINTGNTYKVILKARDKSDPENVLSTEVQSIKTKESDSFRSISVYETLSTGNNYNWGLMYGSDIFNAIYFKIDVSSLYNYSNPNILFINYWTTPTYTFTNQTVKLGHFDVYTCSPNGTNISKLDKVTLPNNLKSKTAEYNAYINGNNISESYVFNDCIYLMPAKMYSTLYDSELTNEYTVGITFVREPSLK